MLRFASRQRALASILAVGLVCLASPARAFEKQWHLGGGLGVAAPGSYDAGPALGVHGAYGLSDVFDLRLELQASHHERSVLPLWFYGARAGLAYKLDVIEWIPYAGISAGGFVITRGGGPLLRPSVGALAGLDYAVSRHFGVGAFGAGDYIFLDSGTTALSVLVRAEYRFGW